MNNRLRKQLVQMIGIEIRATRRTDQDVSAQPKSPSPN